LIHKVVRRMEKHAEETKEFFRVSNEWILLIHKKKNFLNCYSEIMNILNNKKNIKTDFADDFLRKICNTNIFVDNINNIKNPNL
jgi:hypothetical protein